MLGMFLIMTMTDFKQKVRTARQYRMSPTRDPSVPQIWLTYDELATLMGSNLADARRAALAIRLDRRKSRDGQTRAKLTPSLADALLDGMLRQRLEQEIAACAGDLRAMRERMAMGPALAAPKARSAAAG